ncbi:DUF2070 family protein [Vulcanisaeta souniana]|uniref:DUF2070 domain-containing protein n=1 Tax=Vulcanisaeta souniana JCM 11219 TaxID=1293586 RepID=A0A830EID7_9CREN|nr:DUF2070 family protein [Vulcanisaeta souniana]BDR90950.1 hypothetical protein Vsou_00430 [Vulcanisaeta souniana JCM 11219]GGI79569.1 hypothetical protein GCM10007112_15590 [Vulcanisaeta souniana JCM 11219]
MKSRSFEHGYSMIFRGGSLTRYSLLLAIIVIPYLMSLYAHEPIITYLKALVIYSIMFLAVLVTLRAMIYTQSYKGFGTTLSLFNTSLVVFIDLLITLVTHKFIVGFGALSFVLPLSAMIMVLRGLEHNGSSMKKYIIYPLYTLPSVLVTQAFSYLLIGTVSLIKYAILDSVFYVFSFLFIYYVIFKFEASYGGVNILKLFSSYLYASLFEYSEPFERELSRNAVVRDTKVHLFVLSDGGGAGVVTIPELHAGPIAKVGGGYLISDLVNELSRYVKPIVYLHGIGSHELDPATRVDVRKVVRAVTLKVKETLGNETADGECIGRLPVQLHSRNFRITHVPLCDKSLVIVSRLVKSSDDIPLRIYEELKRRTKLDWNNIILIDAQNYYSDDNTWNEDDINELASLLSKIGELEQQRLEMKMCLIHTPKYAFGPIQFEIGDNGLITWGLEVNEKRVLLVVFDGNNLRRELADAIINEFRNYFDIVEVLTTDNHQYTGIARFTRNRGYKVVGDSINHDLIMRHIRRNVKQCLDDMRTMRVKYYPVVVQGIRLIGDSFNDMVRAAELGMIDWKKHFTVLMVLPILTMIALGIALGIL